MRKDRKITLGLGKADKFQTDFKLAWKQWKLLCPYDIADKKALYVRIDHLTTILKMPLEKGMGLNEEILQAGITMIDAEIGVPRNNIWAMTIAMIIIFWKHGEKLGRIVGLDAEELRKVHSTVSVQNTELWKTIDELSRFARGGRER